MLLFRQRKWLAAGLMALLLFSPLGQAQQIIRVIQQDDLEDVFEDASGLHMRDDGAILLTSTDGGRLLVIDDSGIQRVNLLEGIFEDNDVAGVDVLADGRIVMANNGDQLVALVSPQLKLLQRFSRSGDEAGRIDEPMDVAVSASDNIYVADTDNGRISVFNDQGLFLRHIGNSGIDGTDLNKPVQLALDADENLYVLEAGENFRVSIYDRSGFLIKRIGPPQLAGLFGADLDISAMTTDANGILYLGDANSRNIFSFDWHANKIVLRFGVLGQSQGQYRHISLLSINRNGQLAVVDRQNAKLELYQLTATGFKPGKSFNRFRVASAVEAFCRSAQPITTGGYLCLRDSGIVRLDGKGGEAGAFAAEIEDPIAMHVGRELVAILENNRLHGYGLDGKKLFSIGRYGSAEGAFDNARHVFTANNLVYVSDIGNNRIQVFAADGRFVEQIRGSSRTFAQVGPVAVDSARYIHVFDPESRGMIQKLDASSYLRKQSIGVPPASEHRANRVLSMDFDRQDRLYALVESNINSASVRVFQDGDLIAELGSGSDYAGGPYFSEPGTLSVASSSSNTAIVNDMEQGRIFRFDYHEIPQAASGVRVKGYKDRVVVTWDSPLSPLVDRYRVEGAELEMGPFEALGEFRDTGAELAPVDVGERSWFRVVSLSSLGVVSAPSAARHNRFQQLQALYSAKKFAKVIPLAETLSKVDPGNADILHLKADSELELGQLTAALASFQALEESQRYRQQALQQQVEILFRLERYLDARGLVEKLLAEKPKELFPYLLCARLSLELADSISAVTCAEDGLLLFPEHTELRYLLGKSYMSAGVADQGIAEYQRLIDSAATDAGLLLQIADDLMLAQQFEPALSLYRKLVAPPFQLPGARVGEARALLNLDRDDEAKAIAVKLSASKDSRGEGYYILGKIAARQGKHSEAVLRLSRASKLSGRNIDSWLTLAASYLALNKQDDALKALTQGLESNPDSLQLYLAAGRIEAGRENFVNANNLLQKAVELDAQSLEALSLYARGLFATREYRLAARYAEMAARLAPRDVEVLHLQADIASQRGKLGDAIEHLKTAIDMQPASAELQLALGRVYRQANLFDASQLHLEKATTINPTWVEPVVELGHLYSKRRQFDEAIKAFEKAVQLDPSDPNRALLNGAFADKKKSLEFDSNTPQLLLSDLNLGQVFSAAYKQYADKAIGTVEVRNVSATDYGNLQLSFQIKEYMDFPVLQEIPLIKGGESQRHSFKVTFNNRILEVDEDIGVQVEVKLTFLRDGRKDDIRLTQPMTIYGKNAMVWGEADMVGSFVTPKDDTLRDFVRAVINRYRPASGPLNDKIVSAMTFFSALNAAGTRYIVDPNTPYTTLRDDQVDYVQFPRETLRLRSGDCDDLSVLLSAGLENLGIETVLLEVPGHLLLMFNTGLSSTDAGLISHDLSLLAQRDGKLWIPLESTMVNASFNEAWAEGARKYQQALSEGKLGIIDLKKAWSRYKPVTLRKEDKLIALPDEARTSALVGIARNQLLVRSISRLIRPYQALVDNNPGNIDARLQIAILYGRFGLLDEAQVVFDELHEMVPQNSALHNNQGNLHLLQKDADKAIDSYNRAAQLDDKDGGILVNLSMAYYQKGDIGKASEHFSQALQRDPALKSHYAAYHKLLSQ